MAAMAGKMEGAEVTKDKSKNSSGLKRVNQLRRENQLPEVHDNSKMIGYLYETVGYSPNHFILRNIAVKNVARCRHHCCLHCLLDR